MFKNSGCSLEDPISVPTTHTCRFTTAYNTSSREFRYPLQLPTPRDTKTFTKTIFEGGKKEILQLQKDSYKAKCVSFKVGIQE